jgi:hypothetical protein
VSSARKSAIALHVSAAKRLLAELDRSAQTALNALGHESGSDFVAAVEERDRILAQLNTVVEALSQERLGGQAGTEHEAAISALFAEMAQAAAAALDSHNELTAHTRRERDRLANAMHLSSRPDVVANHYSASAGRPRHLSITG